MKNIEIKPFYRKVLTFKDHKEYETFLLGKKRKDNIEDLNDIFGESRLFYFDGKIHITLYINLSKAEKEAKKDKYFVEKLVAHEAYHTALKIYESMGAEYDSELEEPVAYLLDYLVGEVLKYLDE